METIRIGRHEVPASPRISPKVEVRPAPGKGVGLFAVEPVAAGEVLLVWGGESYCGPEGAAAARAAGRGTMEWEDGLCSREGIGDHPAFAVNHSCDPNVWFHDTFTLSARRRIPAGEELGMDYAMLGGEDGYVSEWECRCGAPACRRRITGRDWRSAELRARYRGHFLPALNRRIAAEEG